MDEQNLIVGRRLMVASAEYEARLKQPRFGKQRSLKEVWDADEAQLSGEGVKASSAQATPANDRDVRVRLDDLNRRLQADKAQPAGRQTFNFEFTQTTTELQIEIKAWAPVDGLVVRNRSQAETDRYEFAFSDGSTFRITDKWSGKSTTIWGDPHVDTSDEEGAANGEFSDLKSSNTHTTLELQDGTRVTFTALDNGIIEAVDIFRKGQSLHGVGAASSEWSDSNGLFELQVKSASASLVPSGDTVRAGGDGNDWFDTSGRMVWGKTTGPAPIGRPTALMQISLSQTVTQIKAEQTIERWG